ncbi:MAG: LacI family transcriptional regulator, partial [Desulfovibrionales bacterium]|nr:LacI family transcriptional regulator [Desulfovibrionales bacterium]
MATVKDVAKLAGVSPTTVSAALNGSAPVKEATRKKVLEAVRQTGYKPNFAARSLRSGQSKLIGMIVPNIENPHFARAARVVEQICFEAGYMTMVYSSDEDTRIEMKIIKMLGMQRVAGLIHIPTSSDAGYGIWLQDQVGFPVVLFDSYIENLPYNAVTLDNFQAGLMATEYLLRLGHCKLAVFRGRNNVSTVVDRMSGCREAFKRQGLNFSPALIDANFDQGNAFTAIQQVMSASDKPTAVLSLNNMMTIGILRGLKNLGLSCPRDLSVIGVDNFELSDFIDPAVTVVSQPVDDMAQQAISMLLEEVRGERQANAERQQLAPNLIVRES